MTSPNLPGQRRYVNPILNEAVAIEALRLDLDYLNPETVDPAIARQALASIQQLMPVLRRFQRQLEAVTSAVTVTDGKPGEPCRHCGRPVTPSESGRMRLYCSRSCRQRAYEKRRAGG